MFAPDHAVVAVTTGIVRLLDARELKGVLAHEMAHIKNRDILIGSVAATIAGAVMFLANMAQWGLMFGGGSSDDIAALTRAARAHLRRKFLRADMGVSGANFLIADIGAAMLVTNEGNGRMASTLPRVHVTLAGIDKIIARFADTPALLTLLTRSATGQHISNYVSVNAGARRGGR